MIVLLFEPLVKGGIFSYVYCLLSMPMSTSMSTSTSVVCVYRLMSDVCCLCLLSMSVVCILWFNIVVLHKRT